MNSAARPRARTEAIIVQELDGEVLLYDLDVHEAHCLNDAAAAVWRHCDGETSVAEIARALDTSEEVVWLALERLWRQHLLDGEEPGGGLTRKSVLKRAGIGLAALPIVATLAAPAGARVAVSCASVDDQCSQDTDCCGALICCANVICTDVNSC